MNETALNQLLFSIDPMNTSCAFNEGMEDEYASQARDIALRLTAGEDARHAVVAVFDEWFWEGCLTDGKRNAALELILEELAQLQ